MRKLQKLITVVITVMLVINAIILNLPFGSLTYTAYAATSTVTYNNKTYTTTSGSDMAYRKDNTTFDFIGNYNGVWKQVSYHTNGFSTILSTGGNQYSDINISDGRTYNGLKVNINFNFAKDGSLQVSYSITNTESSSRTFSIGSHADIQIGSEDSAPITPFSVKTQDNKVKGFMMNETSSGAQFNFYARGYAGVTSVDSVWYGAYSSRTGNIFNEGSGTNLTGTDSGMAWSWKNRTIPANSTQTYNVKFIIAEKGSENNVASSGTISLIRIGDIQHSFNVYQLLEGSVNESNTYASVLNWGTGINGYKTLSDDNITTTTGTTVPLNVLMEFVESDESSEKTALIERITLGTPIRSGTSVNGSIAFPNLPCGYYLIRDTTSLSAESEDIVSRDLLIYLDDEGRAVELKRVKPSFGKKVATDGVAGQEWAEAADYGYGEEFNIKLTALIPANEDFAGYSTYRMIFHDTYTSGIDFQNIYSVTYTVGDGAPQTIPAEKYTVTSDTNGLALDIENFAAVAGSAWGNPDNAIKVDVIYTAKLNKTAPVISESVNDGIYSETSSIVSSGTGYLQYSNNATDYSLLGKTASDSVGVFSYKMNNTKYANLAKAGYQLNGAEFKIYRNSVSEENEIKMIYDADSHAYRPVKEDETAETMISGYGINDDDYKGKLDIIGISAGTYVLVESKAPEGYSPIENLTFTFSAVAEENQTGTGAIANITVSKGTGGSEESGSSEKNDTPAGTMTLTNDIIDMLVSEKLLPETGGLGTKMFYFVGICMVTIASVILIVKKRLNRCA